MNGILLCLPVFLPIAAGLAAYFIPFRTDRGRCALYGVTDMANYINPIPAGLVLTGIVVSVSVSALMLSLTIRIYKKYHTLDMDALYVMMSDRRKGGRV